jgi:hypothetical protein
MKKNLAFMSLAMMAMMADTNFGEIPKETKRKYEPGKEPKKVIPNGCKEYVFNERFGTLKVIAMNEKSALKKYNKWCSENQS